MNKNEKKEVVGALKNVLEEAFNENQEKDNQYVVEYRNKATGELLGYHASTFCQTTDERLNGKRYSGDNPYKQLATINKNLNSTLKSTEDNPGFAGISYSVKQACFEGLNPGDVQLYADYLEEGTPKQKFTFTEI